MIQPSYLLPSASEHTRVEIVRMHFRHLALRTRQLDCSSFDKRGPRLRHRYKRSELRSLGYYLPSSLVAVGQLLLRQNAPVPLRPPHVHVRGSRVHLADLTPILLSHPSMLAQPVQDIQVPSASPVFWAGIRNA